MSTNDRWIKMSERKPTEKDYPFWTTSKKGVGLWTYEEDIEELDPDWCTHWQPATLPEPPAKELTQRERDEEGFQSWYDATPDHMTALGHVWHAALAYRDKQNAEDLENVSTIMEWERPATVSVQKLQSLRRRCGLDQ